MYMQQIILQGMMLQRGGIQLQGENEEMLLYGKEKGMCLEQPQLCLVFFHARGDKLTKEHV